MILSDASIVVKIDAVRCNITVLPPYAHRCLFLSAWFVVVVLYAILCCVSSSDYIATNTSHRNNEMYIYSICVFLSEAGDLYIAMVKLWLDSLIFIRWILGLIHIESI